MERWIGSPRTCALLAVLVAVGLTTAPAVVDPTGSSATAAANRTHTVVMGAVDPSLPDPSPRQPATAGRTDRFEYLAYYPQRLRLHRGDTVHFRRDGFHTVTFSAAGTARRGWVRRDEANGVTAEASMAPSDPTCGSAAGQPPCVLSPGVPFLNSGWQDLRIRVDLPAGTYTYYCMLHAGMEGQLEVVPRTTSLPSPARIEADRRARVATDTAAATALFRANQRPRSVVEDGRVRWTVRAGDITDDGRVAILRFMPSALHVAPGDEVVFVLPRELPVAGRREPSSEIHTVTFPDDPTASFGLLRYLDPTCDPDAPDGGQTGARSLYLALVTGCPPGTTLELLFRSWAWRSPVRASGEAVTTPATVHDSGLLVPAGAACRANCDPWDGTRFPSASRALFPTSGTFSYACLVHPEWEMAGSVTVRDG